jgi:hypothetical protein
MKNLTVNEAMNGIMFYSSNKFENYFLVTEYKNQTSTYAIYQRDATTGKWITIKESSYFPYNENKGSEIKYLWRKSLFNDIIIQKRGEDIQFYINNEFLNAIPTKEIVGGGKFGLYSAGGYQLFDDFKLEFTKSGTLISN